MSRIGKLPVEVPASVTISIDGSMLNATGPKGTLSVYIDPILSITQSDGALIIAIAKDTILARQKFGLTRTLVANAVQGVAEGFERKLEINGVGYRAQVAGTKITLALGFSHPVEYTLPDGVSAGVEGNVISLNSHDKQLVGQAAAHLRSLRKPEPYQGKGIKYAEEHVRRKAGKTAGK